VTPAQMAVAESAPASISSTRSSSTSTSSGRRRPPEVLTESEVVTLIRACSTRASTGIRNRTLIAVLWRSGLRIAEALSLELRDLDLKAWHAAGASRQGRQEPYGRRR